MVRRTLSFLFSLITLKAIPSEILPASASSMSESKGILHFSAMMMTRLQKAILP